MMRRIFIIALAISMLPGFVLAANDVTFPQDSTISLDDGSDYTINNDSTFDSFTVNVANIQFVLSASSIISLASLDKKEFGLSGTDDVMTIIKTCEGDRSTLRITVPSGVSGTFTVTVTPSGTCSTSGGVSGGGSSPGGGGGGGGGAASPSAPAPAAGNVISNLDNVSSDGRTISLASSVSAAVSAGSGGQASLSDNSASVSLPAGSVTAETTLNIAPQANFPQPKASYSAVGSKVYNITLSGQSGTLAKPATLTFNYTSDQVEGVDTSTLVVSYWDEAAGAWVDVPTVVDEGNRTVTATVNHFTRFILQAKSKTVPPGSLIKIANKTAVYYLGHDSKRYVFPDDKVFYSWYSDFKDVVTVTPEQLASYSLGGNLTVRSGTKLVQFVTYNSGGKMMVDDPKVYAVEPNGVLRWIKTASVAIALYGNAWETRIVPVTSVMFGNYTVGDPIETAVFPTGSVVKETSSNTLYYIDGNQKRIVTTGGKVANKFMDANILSASSLSGYENAGAVNDYQNSLSWTGGK